MAVALAGPAQAGVVHNGWLYAIDSFTDGYAGGQIGGVTNFEFYGIAMKRSGSVLNVAISSNLPLGGVAAPGAPSNLISYGDLLFNFSGLNLVDASNAGRLSAVRFDGSNDSGFFAGPGNTGTASQVSAKNLSAAHFGFATNAQHAARATALGGSPSMADLSDTDAYFQNNTLNLMDQHFGTGSAGGGAADNTFYDGTGLDFANFGAVGNHIVTFGMDLTRVGAADWAGFDPLSSTGWTAHLYAECANDGLAMTPIPEPATVTLMGLGFLGAGIARRRKNRK
jgi:hypothetical protein